MPEETPEPSEPNSDINFHASDGELSTAESPDSSELRRGFDLLARTAIDFLASGGNLSPRLLEILSLNSGQSESDISEPDMYRDLENAGSNFIRPEDFPNMIPNLEAGSSPLHPPDLEDSPESTRQPIIHYDLGDFEHLWQSQPGRLAVPSAEDTIPSRPRLISRLSREERSDFAPRRSEHLSILHRSSEHQLPPLTSFKKEPLNNGDKNIMMALLRRTGRSIDEIAEAVRHINEMQYASTLSSESKNHILASTTAPGITVEMLDKVFNPYHTSYLIYLFQTDKELAQAFVQLSPKAYKLIQDTLLTSERFLFLIKYGTPQFLEQLSVVSQAYIPAVPSAENEFKLMFASMDADDLFHVTQTWFNPLMRSWVMNGSYTNFGEFISKIKEKPQPLPVLGTLLHHAAAPEFMNQVSFDQLERIFLELNFDSTPLNVVIELFLTYPQLIHEYLLLKDNPPQTWPEKFRAAHRIIVILDRHGVTDTELNATVLQATPPEQLLLSEDQKTNYDILYGHSSEGKLAEVTARLRAQTPELRDTIRTVTRQRIMAAAADRGAHLSEADLAEMTPAQLKALERMAVRESEFSPIKHLVPRTGPEIETTFGPWQKLPFRVLEKAGFHLGGDSTVEIEHAPGPFRDYHTVITWLEWWINAELLDVVKRTESGLDTTLHFNVELEKSDNVYALISMLQAMAYTYLPTYDPGAFKSGNFDHKLVVKSNGGKHIDCKCFWFLTPDGFAEFWRVATLFSSALLAYQTTQRTAQTKGSVNYNLELEAERIYVLPHLTQDQVELAVLWLEIKATFEEGLAQLDLTSVLKPSVPSSKIAKFSRQISNVYQTAWDTLNDPRNLPGEPITSQGKKFPNMVAFARHYGHHFSNQAEQIIEGAERDFFYLLDQVSSLASWSSQGKAKISKKVAQTREYAQLKLKLLDRYATVFGFYQDLQPKGPGAFQRAQDAQLEVMLNYFYGSEY